MNDLRFAFRQLRIHRHFTAVALVALVLGIGANTAIFSVVDAVLLAPLPFPLPDQLVAIGGETAGDGSRGGPLNTLSFPEFFDLRSRNQSFAELAAYREKAFAFSAGADVQSLRGQRVAGNFFAALGVEPALGRTFGIDDERAGGGPHGLGVVLGNAFWRRQFSADPNVLGRQMMLDRQAFTIIGVMPAGFQFPIEADPTDIYVSTAIDAAPASGQPPNTEQRGNRQVRGIGRLRAGVSLEQARSEMHRLAGILEKEQPATNTGWDYAVRPLGEYLVANVRLGLWVLTGAVACVLLIACVNVASLLLARASVREREIAIRLAIGAGRGRIIRQLLTESVLLSAIAGVLGLLVAFWATQALVALVPQNIPRAASIHVDARVLFFTLGISLVTGVVFGLAPAFQATRVDLEQALKVSARGAAMDRERSRRGQALVMCEVALALVLLVAAGLLLQSLGRLGRVDPGLQTERLLTARVTLPDSGYTRPESIALFYERLMRQLRAVPGVRAVSTVFPLPMSGAATTTSFDLADNPLPANRQPSSVTRLTGADYFQTMGMPLVRGRFFADSDRLQSTPVVIINERFAERYFPGQDPVGRKMTTGWAVGNQPPQMRDIVGVVGNARHLSLQDDFVPEMYVPVAQVPYPSATILVRTETSMPEAMVNTVRRELAGIDPALPLTSVRLFDEYRMGSLAGARFNALLLSLFAALALVLTAIGIYGVVGYSVSARTREIGIRMSLGALPSSIFRLVVRQTMGVVGIGVGVGLAGALACAPLMGSMLYAVGRWDPVTFAATTGVLAAVALFACWWPARRAASVDPIEALRGE